MINKKIIEIYNKTTIITSPICAACKGCCTGCGWSEGYFGLLGEVNGKERFKLACTKAKFDDSKGFLTDKGCGLPPRYRSIGCLTFYCNKIPSKEAKLFNKMWRLLRERTVMRSKTKTRTDVLPITPYWKEQIMGLNSMIIEGRFTVCQYCCKRMATECATVSEAIHCSNAVTHVSVSCEEPIAKLNATITPCKVFQFKEYYYIKYGQKGVNHENCDKESPNSD